MFEDITHCRDNNQLLALKYNTVKPMHFIKEYNEIILSFMKLLSCEPVIIFVLAMSKKVLKTHW